MARQRAENGWSKVYKYHMTKCLKNKIAGGLWKRARICEAVRTLNKVPSFKQAIEGGLSDVYNDPNERYPIVQDPSLVRAAQLACLLQVNTLPSAKYAIKMYASMERKVNHLLSERSHVLEVPVLSHLVTYAQPMVKCPANTTFSRVTLFVNATALMMLAKFYWI